MSKTKRSTSKRISDPPLNFRHRVAINPNTGALDDVLEFQKGVLSQRHWSEPKKIVDGPRARQALETLANRIREGLRKKGFPNDTVPLWQRDPYGIYYPAEVDTPVDAPSSFTWQHVVYRLTKPLALERIAADLLFVISDALKLTNSDEHLPHLLFGMKFYADLRISGEINRLAYEGMQARKIRGRGPEFKRNRAESTRQIIMAAAEAYWTANPIRHKAIRATTDSIADTVNEGLRSKGLLPRGKQRLSHKTIRDHLAISLRGQKIRTG